ncbi:hypothetical protein TGVAND_253740 [Toxoplasma gondii VAND]|uniref:Uncharacterized protein n=1 Tax=Toxoplasma gondii VAND TaxID=933077 RepID=A0A086Q1U7_TOXGO|nr:hypothetical protein TGVAND_253740 [Toxoplasma gondii VAND]
MPDMSVGQSLLRAGDEARRLQDWGEAESLYCAALSTVRGRGEKAAIYARRAALLLDASSDPELVAQAEHHLHLLPSRPQPRVSAPFVRSLLPSSCENQPSLSPELRPFPPQAGTREEETEIISHRGGKHRKTGHVGEEKLDQTEKQKTTDRTDCSLRSTLAFQRASAGSAASCLDDGRVDSQQREVRPGPYRRWRLLLTQGRLTPLLGRRRRLFSEGLLSPGEGTPRRQSRGWGGRGELALVEQARWHAARALKLNPRSFSSLYSSTLTDAFTHRWRSGAVFAAAALSILTGRGTRAFLTRRPSSSFPRSGHGRMKSLTFSSSSDSSLFRNPSRHSVQNVCFRALPRPIALRSTSPDVSAFAMPERTARYKSLSPRFASELGPSGHLSKRSPSVLDEDASKTEPSGGELGLTEKASCKPKEMMMEGEAKDGPPVSPSPWLGSLAAARWQFRRRLSEVSSRSSSAALSHSSPRQADSRSEAKSRKTKVLNLRSPSQFQVYTELKVLRMRCSLLSGRPAECLRNLCALLETARVAEAAGTRTPASALVDWRNVVEEGLFLGAQSACELLSESVRRRQPPQNAGAAGIDSPFFTLDWPLLEKIQEGLAFRERTDEAQVTMVHYASSTGELEPNGLRAAVPHLLSCSALSLRDSSPVPSYLPSREKASILHGETAVATWRDTVAVAQAAALLFFRLPRAPDASLSDTDIDLLRLLSSWSSVAFKACFLSACQRGDYDRMAAAAAWRARCFLQMREWDDAVRESTQALAIDLWTPAEVFASPPPCFLSTSLNGRSNKNSALGGCRSEKSGSQAGLPLLSLFSPLHIRAAAHALSGRGQEAAADFALSRYLMRLPSLEAHLSVHPGSVGNEDARNGKPENTGHCTTEAGMSQTRKTAKERSTGSGEEAKAAVFPGESYMDEAETVTEERTASEGVHPEKECLGGEAGAGKSTQTMGKRLLNPREPAVRWDRTPAEKARLKSRMENRRRVIFSF